MVYSWTWRTRFKLNGENVNKTCIPLSETTFLKGCEWLLHYIVKREGILCYTRLQWYLWLIQSIDKHFIIKYIPLWSKQQFKDPVFYSFELVFVRIDPDNQLISLILKVWSLKTDNITAKDKKKKLCQIIWEKNKQKLIIVTPLKQRIIIIIMRMKKLTMIVIIRMTEMITNFSESLWSRKREVD